jgi:hypothetical protein
MKIDIKSCIDFFVVTIDCWAIDSYISMIKENNCNLECNRYIKYLENNCKLTYEDKFYDKEECRNINVEYIIKRLIE